MPINSFTIKHEIFEGPLDLLLHLVEKRKLFINDISLSKITDEYIQYIESIPHTDIEHRANFIMVASTLLLVKSKSLLPMLDLTTEEEENIDDLEKRLKLLQRFRELSVGIQSMFGKHISFEQSQTIPSEIVFVAHQGIQKISLIQSILNVLHSLPKKEKIPTAIIKKIKSLEETIDILTKRIGTSLKMSFSDFSKKLTDGTTENIAEVKVNIIVGFLAMLELVKQGIISVEQDSKFGDIQMESKNLNTPRYSDN